MGNTQKKRNISQYTKLGLLLDELCTQKSWSFYQFAKASGTSKTSIVLVSTGKRQPTVETVKKWCQALDCDQGTVERMMHLAGHATDKERDQPEVAEDQTEKLLSQIAMYQQANKHLAATNRQLKERISVLEQQNGTENRSRPTSRKKVQVPTTGLLPKQYVSLIAFANHHGVAERRAVTHATMELPLLKAVRGEWTDRDGATVTLALDAKGKAAFYQLYHGDPAFILCEQCPHK